MPMPEHLVDIIEKYEQRQRMTESVKNYISDGSTGTMTLNDSIVIRFSNKKIDNFSYDGETYVLDKESFRKIVHISDVNTSVMLEEVYKICERASQ